jgi:hypothetical protein
VSSSSSSTGKAKSSTKNKTLDWLVIGDWWWLMVKMNDDIEWEWRVTVGTAGWQQK